MSRIEPNFYMKPIDVALDIAYKSIAYTNDLYAVNVTFPNASLDVTPPSERAIIYMIAINDDVYDIDVTLNGYPMTVGAYRKLFVVFYNSNGSWLPFQFNYL